MLSKLTSPSQIRYDQFQSLSLKYRNRAVAIIDKMKNDQNLYLILF